MMRIFLLLILFMTFNPTNVYAQTTPTENPLQQQAESSQGGLIQGSAQEYTESEEAKAEREKRYISEPKPYNADTGSMMLNFTQGFSNNEYDF